MIAQAWLPPLLSLLRKCSWPDCMKRFIAAWKWGFHWGEPRNRDFNSHERLEWRKGQGGADWKTCWAKAQAEWLGSREQQNQSTLRSPLLHRLTLWRPVLQERHYFTLPMCACVYVCVYTNLLEIRKKGSWGHNDIGSDFHWKLFCVHSAGRKVSVTRWMGLRICFK